MEDAASRSQKAAASPYSAALSALARGDWLTRDDWIAVARVSRAWHAIVDAVVHAQQTLLVTHPTCARHHIPRRSERPERLQFVLERCRERWSRLRCADDFACATPAQLARFHSDVHVDTIHRLAAKIERSMAALDALELEDRALIGSPRAAARSASDGAAMGKTRVHRGGSFNHDEAPCSPSSSYFVKRPERPKSKASYYAQFEYIDLDSDTILMRHTLAASLAAIGGVCHAIDRVLAGDARNAFCVVRPPGHHAEPQRSMGFCFFNNVGVGACHALDAHQLTRVAIIDFDVHHGNGTQRGVEAKPELLYVSLHQSPLFPHTGFARERGEHDNIVNIPLPARTSAAVYREQFRRVVRPRVEAFAPQLVLISAGFDGHEKDPLSNMRLQARDFYWMTQEIVRMAWRCCQGRVVSVLEGGYMASALADSAEQHVLALAHGAVPQW
ncbi:hypothetical protein P43SY_004533 [Pythium insidiosum]|uniref:histone deacetylase n=1 Tax=Pythium insidiosum TaxID=114742 RepID=A0AAD5M6U7_PYTIN|nr:hypothetical protein P43SY_004533 [Pythium insidiosum]